VDCSKVAADVAVSYCDTRGAGDSTAARINQEANNRQSIYHRVSLSLQAQGESAMSGDMLAVDNRRRHDVWVVGVCAAHGEAFALEGDVAIAIAGVGAIGDNYFVTVIGIVNRGLNIVEICRTVVVDSDSSRLRANNKNQAGANED
jgi:hypothetical protein